MMKMNTGKKKKIRPYILEWKPMQQYGEEKKSGDSSSEYNQTDGARTS